MFPRSCPLQWVEWAGEAQARIQWHQGPDLRKSGKRELVIIDSGEAGTCQSSADVTEEIVEQISWWMRRIRRPVSEMGQISKARGVSHSKNNQMHLSLSMVQGQHRVPFVVNQLQAMTNPITVPDDDWCLPMREAAATLKVKKQNKMCYFWSIILIRRATGGF